MKQRPRSIAALCAVFFVAIGVQSAGGQTLADQLHSLVAAANIGNTHVAMMVMDLDTGQILAEQNADDPMIPASNAKLVTVAAALDTLGKNFIYHTRLKLLPPEPVAGGATTAPQVEELPRLVVVGDGDPAFGDPVLLKKYGYVVDDLLNQWVGAVAKTGIKHFSTLLVDDRIFDQQFIYPDWPKHQLIRDYCAQVAGIDFYLNCLDVMPIPASTPGQPARIKLFPPAPFIPTTNNTVTKQGGYFAMDRKLGTNQLIFTGSVGEQPSSPYQITVNDPPMVFGKILKYQLKLKGITVDHVARPAQEAQLPPGRVLAVATTTLPLVLARCAEDSQNMFAESLFKRIGYALTGHPGSWSNGAAAVRIFLQRRLGPDSSGIHIVDGSGMSRDNRVTARLLVELLQSMYDNSGQREVYMHSLAHAGVNGTLDDRMEHLNDAEVYAKTGYLTGVSALTGYLLLDAPNTTTAATDPKFARAIAFSFLFNGFKPPIHNYNMKKLQNSMVKLVAKLYAPAAAK